MGSVAYALRLYEPSANVTETDQVLSVRTVVVPMLLVSISGNTSMVSPATPVPVTVNVWVFRCALLTGWVMTGASGATVSIVIVMEVVLELPDSSVASAVIV